MSELRQKFSLSYPKIGKLFGNLDHTTVIASLRRVEILKARGEL
jgi:chromosomal replication initiation ATPase DnaA